MKNNSNHNNILSVDNVIKYLITVIIIIIIIIIYSLFTVLGTKKEGNKKQKNHPISSSVIKRMNFDIIDKVPDDFKALPFEDNEEGKMAQYGYDLITKTYTLIGPNTKKSISGNNLSCTNCHLNGGTKPYAAPYIGLSGVFPTYIGRENKIESLEERINGCFERSLNGKAIDVNSYEMRSIISYIKHISKGVPIGKRIKGQGFVDFKTPNRAANPVQGAVVYEKKCISCHGSDGQGKKGSVGNRKGEYIYPPLWGEGSYNDGAGLARLITTAKFIKGNMPLGATYNKSILSDEDAFDVAAYINSKSRAVLKLNKELDYPDLSKKPKDCPYPPYEGEFSQEQHKIGPYNTM